MKALLCDELVYGYKNEPNLAVSYGLRNKRTKATGLTFTLKIWSKMEIIYLHTLRFTIINTT